MIKNNRKGMSSVAKQDGERIAKIMDEGPHSEVIKMLTTLTCIICGKVFGPMTYGVASETLPICPKCKATRKKVKRGSDV